jgi:hypothetical protein
MPTLHIALQEGFSGDEVAVRINGREIFHKTGVKTRMQIGFADSAEIDAQPGVVEVEIALPARNAVKQVRLQLTAPCFLAVSIGEDNTINTSCSETPFQYA